MKEQSETKMQQKDSSIVYIRVCAMWMIIACHLMSQTQYSLAHIAAMFLNVGVELFFMISAYLYGWRKINSDVKSWYKKRLCRIAVPCYIFLILLFCIYLGRELNIDGSNWCAQFLFLQGFEIYVFGAEHLWFITVLLFCYLITPLLQWVEYRYSFKRRLICFSVSVASQIVATYYISTQLGRYWLLVNFYAICYELGSRKLKCQTIKQFFFAAMLGLLGVVGRLIGKVYVDETIVYNVFISGITHCMLAASIFGILQFLTNNRCAGKLALYLDSISYEAYLVHYMLIGGPISLFYCTDSFIMNCGVVFISAIALASLINLCASTLLKEIGKSKL